MTEVELCFFHNTESEERRKDAQIKGGQNGRKHYNEPTEEDVRLKNTDDVLVLLEKTVRDLRANRISEKRATALGYLANIALRGIEKNEIETRLERIENLVGKR